MDDKQLEFFEAEQLELFPELIQKWRDALRWERLIKYRIENEDYYE